MNEQLIRELYSLREKLKQKNPGASICNDRSLEEIAKFLPKKIEDFQAIYGVGDVFIENYAKDFLYILQKYNKTSETHQLDQKHREFISRLENKLIDISKRNPHLYLSSTNSANYLDLCDLIDVDVIDALFFKKNKRLIELCNVKKYPDTQKIYTKANRLFRKLNLDLTEKGEYNLYIAYPFVEGTTFDGVFSINAPLLYFPVVMEKDDYRFVIKVDGNREVILNESLIIMAMKFITKKEIEITDIEFSINNMNYDTFESELIKKYEEFGIKLDLDDVDESLLVLDKENIVGQKGFKIRKFMVLGRFSAFSNNIHRDIAMIKNQGVINQNLYNIMFGDKINVIEPTDCKWHVNQINQLDYSQLKVVNLVDRNESIVIEGPPGTGKSQTIVSIISNQVSKGYNVLMVAEKKAAIDVIYSRLKDLREYSLLIDDASNKTSFYSQLQNLVSKDVKDYKDSEKELNIDDQIKARLNRYNHIVETLNDKGLYDVSMIQLFNDHHKILMNDQDAKHYRTVSRFYKKYFSKLTYKEATSNLNLLYRDDKEDFGKLMDIIKDREYITWFKKNLEYDDFLDLSLKVEEFQGLKKGSILKRIFKGMLFPFTLIRFSWKFFKLSKIVKNMKIEEDVQKYYGDYQNINSDFKKLSRQVRRFYIDMYDYQVDKTCDFDYDTMMNYYGNFLIGKLLKRYKSEIKSYGQLTKDYESINALYRSLIDLNENKLLDLLDDTSDEVKELKRYTNILKAINSTRLPNIASFLEKFRFEMLHMVKIWLVTPNVVSTLLPMEKDLFDICIFDEASQMYLEKAIPSLYRAKRCVISGDTKQLRPSSFGFGRLEGIQEDDYALEDFSVLDDESLLDFAKNRLPSFYLEYHYRSKYQELINLSNYVFYKRKLIVPPYRSMKPEIPLEYIDIKDALWDDKQNRVEAKKVVETLEKILNETKGEKSIGIITFNLPQRDLIEDLIDARCRESEAFATLYGNAKNKVEEKQNMGLFIKNIENVQGDERDIILISVGYSYNANGVFQRQFGWLSQKFGENRLNVCVTRAKYKIYLFVSFNLDDFEVDDLANEGPRILKEYLTYAKYISNLDYFSSINYLNTEMKIKEDEKIVSKDLFFSNQAYEIFNVNHTQGSPINYLIKAKEDNKEIGLLVHRDGDAYQKDYYFLERYLKSVNADFHRVHVFNYWKNPDAYLNGLVKKMEEVVYE